MGDEGTVVLLLLIGLKMMRILICPKSEEIHPYIIFLILCVS